MNRKTARKWMAGALACAVVLSGTNAFAWMQSPAALAEENEPQELTKALTEEDIDIRMGYDDTTNLGSGREVTLSDGTTLTIRDNGDIRKDLDSQYLADHEMGAGINLGNTLEATWLVDAKKTITDRTQYDTAWSQPVTDRKLIQSMHSFGINTLRIPVAWSNGDMDDGTYKINPLLLDRVEEVANYALDEGMYVVINDHWDNQWWGQFGACKLDEAGEKIADEQTRAQAWVRYEKYWQQIAARFEGYSDHLIFEGANEELGTRLNDAICLNGPAKGYAKPTNADSTIQVLGGNLTKDEQYDTTNRINQLFVDTVRAAGGNNAYRHLLISGFDTDLSATGDSRFKMPEDTQENGTSKLFVSVHFYTPGDFCLSSPEGDYTTDDQVKAAEYFSNLKRFSDAGYAVIVGECAVCEPSSVTSSVTQWYYDTFKLCQQYHAVPVLWDTGLYFDRKTYEINYKDIAMFYNTVNQTHGTVTTDRVTGGAKREMKPVTAVVPDYIDKAVWSTPGLHAYLYYQTTTWDYRNAYKPARKMSKNENSWAYVQATGSEVNAATTKVVDVALNGDGQYTVSLDGADLSAANQFQMLGVATDILKSEYPDVSMTVDEIAVDGQVQELATNTLVQKSDNPYNSFMAINSYDGDHIDDYPLGKANGQTLKLPRKSISLTFTVSGLEDITASVADGSYVDPENDAPLSEVPRTSYIYASEVTPTPVPTQEATQEPSAEPAQDVPAEPAQTPAQDPQQSQTPSGSQPPQTSQAPQATVQPGTNQPSVPDSGQTVNVGDTFEQGLFSYRVAAADKAEVTGLTATGKKAATLKVPAKVTCNGQSLKVASLGKGVFAKAGAKKIVLNKYIKVIPARACKGCSKLQKLTLQARLSKVAKGSFAGCKKKIRVQGKAVKANIKKLKKSGCRRFTR